MIVLKFSVTTDAAGAATVTLTNHPFGPHLLYAVEWVDGDLADGVDATLSFTSGQSGVEKTLLTLTDANVDLWYYPRIIADGVTGADLTGWYTEQIVDGALKLVVAQGGDTKTGAMFVYLRRPDERR